MPARAAHPCFDRGAQGRHGRVHLPVAPACNIQCNFCNRKFDCVNESRPGVTSRLLSPEAAVGYVEEILRRRPEISVAGIAGPGDPFANTEETLATLEGLRSRFPSLLLCVASNGLELAPFADDLAQLKVGHATVTMTALSPEIGARIYSWVRTDGEVHKGESGAALLIGRQLEAIRALKAAGITVKVNAIVVPGVNEKQIPEIARAVARLGADRMNCIPFLPVAGTPFEGLPEPESLGLAALRLQCGEHIGQMSHCARCRADAVGYLGETMTPSDTALLRDYSGVGGTGDGKPYVAVASREGALVDLHLGEASCLLIFSEDPSAELGFRFKGIRRMPRGAGCARWNSLADLLHDCRAVLVKASGSAPKEALEKRGVRTIEMDGWIEHGLRNAFWGDPLPKEVVPYVRSPRQGSGCRGKGAGCFE